MSEPTNDANQALIDAMLALEPVSLPVEEYRFYFDSEGIGILKTTADISGSYIVITKEEYDAIHASQNWQVKKGKVSLIPLALDTHLMLSLSNSGYATIKDKMIFRVDDAYLGEKDYWAIRTDANDD